jgi:hypothetical protein
MFNYPDFVDGIARNLDYRMHCYRHGARSRAEHVAPLEPGVTCGLIVLQTLHP